MLGLVVTGEVVFLGGSAFIAPEREVGRIREAVFDSVPELEFSSEVGHEFV